MSKSRIHEWNEISMTPPLPSPIQWISLSCHRLCASKAFLRNPAIRSPMRSYRLIATFIPACRRTKLGIYMQSRIRRYKTNVSYQRRVNIDSLSIVRRTGCCQCRESTFASHSFSSSSFSEPLLSSRLQHPSQTQFFCSKTQQLRQRQRHLHIVLEMRPHLTLHQTQWTITSSVPHSASGSPTLVSPSRETPWKKSSTQPFTGSSA